MLDQRVARDLLPLVNQPDFDELFTLYLDNKKESAYRILEQRDDEVEIYRAQGQLHILRRMENMRLEIQTAAKGT